MKMIKIPSLGYCARYINPERVTYIEVNDGDEKVTRIMFGPESGASVLVPLSLDETAELINEARGKAWWFAKTEDGRHDE